MQVCQNHGVFVHLTGVSRIRILVHKLPLPYEICDIIFDMFISEYMCEHKKAQKIAWVEGCEMSDCQNLAPSCFCHTCNSCRKAMCNTHLKKCSICRTSLCNDCSWYFTGYERLCSNCGTITSKTMTSDELWEMFLGIGIK